MPYLVSACICHNHSFEELMRLAQKNNFLTFEAIAAATNCGTNCGMCQPYIEHMLQTGETSIPLIEDN